MLLRRSTRWKLAQWVRRQRFRLAGVTALIAILATASLAGWLQSFEASFLDLLFQIRGDRDSTHRVVIVSRSRAADKLPLLVERILGDAPAAVVVPLHAAAAPSLARLPCDPRVLYVTRGDERFGKDCTVLRPSHRIRQATTIRTHDASGVRTLTGRVLEMVRSPVGDPPSRIAVNFTRSMPAIAAAASGASRVYISDVAPEKFAKIEAYPTIHAVDVSRQDLGEAVREATDGWGADVVFEASGSPHVFGNLWEIPAPGGTVVLVGIPVDPVPLDVAAAQARELRIETVFRYANSYQRAIELAASPAVDLGALISATYPFEDAVAAFERGAEGRPTDTKIQIRVAGA